MAPQERSRRSWKRRLRWPLFILVPLLLLAVGGYFYVTGGRYVSIDNAYVKADKVNITTDIAGMVAKVEVRDNQHVAAGQVLFRLDDEPFRLALARAQAQLASVRNDIEAMKASYRQKQEELKTARTNVDFYQREYQRQADLAGRHVVSQAQLDKARRDLDTARQQAASLVQQLASIAADLNGDPNIPVEKHPRYLAAEAARDQAARDLAHTVVKAPTAGVVTNVDSLQPGEYLAAASPAFSLVAIDHVWVEANPKETQLTYVRPGQPATVDVDTYPGVEWRGEVASLSPASGSEFALLPAQNTSGNWVKVVQRIPIRIRIKTQPGQPPLRAGMSVEVEIDTGHRRNVLRFLAGLFGGGGQKKAA